MSIRKKKEVRLRDKELLHNFLTHSIGRHLKPQISPYVDYTLDSKDFQESQESRSSAEQENSSEKSSSENSEKLSPIPKNKINFNPSTERSFSPQNLKQIF